MAKKTSTHTKHKKTKSHHAQKKEFSWKKLDQQHKLLLVLGAIVVIIIVAVLVSRNNLGNDHIEGSAAIVNDEIITQQYIDDQYERIPPQYKELVTKDMLLNQTINTVLLMQDAQKAGVSVSDQEIDVVIQELVAGAGLTVEDFSARLEQQGIPMEFLRSEYEKQLTVNKHLEQLFADVAVSEAEAKDYYDSTIRASHILVTTEDEAQEVLELLENGSDFAVLAEERSIDTVSAARGGDLDVFGKGTMVAPFEAAAFALQEGAYTKTPVKSDFGFHIILRTAKDKSFEDSKDEIMQLLSNQKKAEQVPAYIEELRENARIEVFS